jgi:hypothetical protein
MTINRLVEDARLGDEGAFAGLVKRHPIFKRPANLGYGNDEASAVWDEAVIIYGASKSGTTVWLRAALSHSSH